MKIIAHTFAFLAIIVVAHAEEVAKITPDEVLKKLNQEGLIDIVFWMKPDLMHPAPKTISDPRIDPIWMATIANHSEENVVINKYWFSCNDWFDVTDVKSGKGVARYSSFPCKEIEPLVIESGQTIDIKVGWSGFVCFTGSSTDDGVIYSDPGTYLVSHDLFPSAGLRFSITAKGAITIHFPEIYPTKNTEK
ncbi:MAG: hypothetical protein ABJQ29_08960 [Luteolibacter sp.]